MKQRLARALNTFLTPIRESRHSHKRDHGLPDDIVFEASRKARRGAQKTRAEVRQALKLYRPKTPEPGYGAHRYRYERAEPDRAIPPEGDRSGAQKGHGRDDHKID